MKKEGDQILANEMICEVTLDVGLTIAINTGQDGYLASIMKNVGDEVAVDSPIALYVNDKDTLLSYIDTMRMASYDDEKEAVLQESADEKKLEIDAKSLLRQIRRLIQSGDIEEGSGE